jgi:uncharacterized cupredoxin-like copper-binding protein
MRSSACGLLGPRVVIVLVVLALAAGCVGSSDDSSDAKRATDAPFDPIAVDEEWRAEADAACAEVKEGYGHLAHSHSTGGDPDGHSVEEPTPDDSGDSTAGAGDPAGTHGNEQPKDAEDLAAELLEALKSLELPTEGRSEATRLLDLAEEMTRATVARGVAASEADGAGIDRATSQIGRVGEQINELAVRLGVPACGDERECQPIGEDLSGEPDHVVEVTLTDHRFAPNSFEVGAGTIRFATENIGSEAHELAVLPGGGDVPFTEDGEPDEEALKELGAFELESYSPGRDCAATWDLEPGDYTLFCIVTAPDGETHYEKGMTGTLTVR